MKLYFAVSKEFPYATMKGIIIYSKIDSLADEPMAYNSEIIFYKEKNWRENAQNIISNKNLNVFFFTFDEWSIENPKNRTTIPDH